MSIKQNYLETRYWMSNAGPYQVQSDIERLYGNIYVASQADSTTLINRVFIPIPQRCYPVTGGANPNGAIVANVGLYLCKTEELKNVDWEGGVVLDSVLFEQTVGLATATLFTAGANAGDYVVPTLETIAVTQVSITAISNALGANDDTVYWQMPYETDPAAYTTRNLKNYGGIRASVSLINSTGNAIGYHITPFIDVQKLRV